MATYITKLNEDDVQESTRFLDKFLSYDRREWATPASTKVIGYVARNNNDLSGVGLMSIYQKSDFEKLFPEVARFLPHTDSVSLFPGAAVRPGTRRKGIYSRIFEARQEWLLSCGVDTLVVLTRSTSQIPLSFYEKRGMREVIRIEKYWEQYLIESKAECPRCGSHCECSAVFLMGQLAE